jgi:hypothetical protein
MRAETESARAQRMATKLVSGPYLPSETDQRDGRAAKDDSDASITGAVASGAPPSDQELTKRLKTRRREELFNRLKTSIDATESVRKDSAEAFKAVQTYLATGVASQTARTTGAQPVLAPKQQVHGGSDMRDRASHIYGAWTQRSNAVATVAKSDAAEACASLDELARLHGVYYSLQGDPILSTPFRIRLRHRIQTARQYRIR